jgi:ketosteroid isomerase-like protein
MPHPYIHRALLTASAAIVLTLTQACVSSSSTVTEDKTATVAALTHQADEWDKAIVRKDRAAIAGNMSEDFRQIDGDGDIEDKASFIDGVTSPKLDIAPYTVEDFQVRVYGDAALLSGRTRMDGRYNGKPFKVHYRYIDVYVRKDGAWRIASVQITKLKT